MTPLVLPWLELSVAALVLGAAVVSLVRDRLAAYRVCLGCCTASLLCTLLLYAGTSVAVESWGLRKWVGLSTFAVDDLNAPLLPLMALLQLLTVLMTDRTRFSRISFPLMMIQGAIRLAAFACLTPWLLIALLAIDATFPYFDLRTRGRPVRLYAIHMALFVGLLIVGWLCVAVAGAMTLGTILLLAAVLARTGAVPFHLWIADLYQNGSFGSAILSTAPLAGVYLLVRLVLPNAPGWTLETFGIMALVSAVYAAGLGLVQTDTRRFFSCFFISHGSLVLVGLGLHSLFAVTGSLVMWFSASLALAGIGLILRALEARVGPLTMTQFRGLYEQCPALAICFLLAGLAAVGFPGTPGFVAIEMLVDEAVGAHEFVGLVVVLIAALNGIGIVRAYLLLFTGRRHECSVGLGIAPRERIAVLTIMGLMLGAGLAPQAYLESRHAVAEALLRGRHTH